MLYGHHLSRLHKPCIQQPCPQGQLIGSRPAAPRTALAARRRLVSAASGDREGPSTNAAQPWDLHSQSQLPCPLHACLARHGVLDFNAPGAAFSGPRSLGMTAEEVASSLEQKLVALKAEGLQPLHMRSILSEAGQAVLWCSWADFESNLALLRELPAACPLQPMPPPSLPGLTPLGWLLTLGAHEKGDAAAFLGSSPAQVQQLLSWLEGSLGVSAEELAGCSQLLRALAVPPAGAKTIHAALLWQLQYASANAGGAQGWEQRPAATVSAAAVRPGGLGEGQAGSLDPEELARSLFLARPDLFGRVLAGTVTLPDRLQYLGDTLGLDVLQAAELAVREPRLLDEDVQAWLPAWLEFIEQAQLASDLHKRLAFKSGGLPPANHYPELDRLVLDHPHLALVHPTLLAQRLAPLQRHLGLSTAGALAAVAAVPQLLTKADLDATLPATLHFLDSLHGVQGAGQVWVRDTAPELALFDPRLLDACFLAPLRKHLGLDLEDALEYLALEPRLLRVANLESTLPSLLAWIDATLGRRGAGRALLAAPGRALQGATLALFTPQLLAQRLVPLQQHLGLDGAGALALAAEEPRVLLGGIEADLPVTLEVLDACLGGECGGGTSGRELAIDEPKLLALAIQKVSFMAKHGSLDRLRRTRRWVRLDWSPFCAGFGFDAEEFQAHMAWWEGHLKRTGQAAW